MITPCQALMLIYFKLSIVILIMVLGIQKLYNNFPLFLKIKNNNNKKTLLFLIMKWLKKKVCHR